jgi:glycerol-3-phosphate dehydrogenase
MMKKLLKLGLGANAAFLIAGYYNSKHQSDQVSLAHSNDIKKMDKETFKLYEDKLQNFNKNFPGVYVNKPVIDRKESLEKLQKEKMDILIIGGGSSGAGLLMEADRKGYKVGLIESNDFSSGTSSRSTKLIHGGIRYLQDVFTPGAGHHVEKLKLVFEALQERDFLLNSLPYMNNLVEIKIPYRNLIEMDYYYLGVFVYHFLYAMQNFPSITNTIPWPRVYFNQKQLSFFEGQMFDSRQCLLSITSGQNSTYANYTLFKEYIYDSEGKIIGIKAYDKLNNKELQIFAECIVNCTGVYADTNFNKEDQLQNKMITASKGTHIVVDKNLFKDYLDFSSGYMMPKTTDGRILFVLPYQRNYFLIGTTDTEMEKSEQLAAESVEVDYIFNELKFGFKFTDEELKKNIKSQWAGLRPLVRAISKNNDSKLTKSLARNHIIRVDDKTGLVSLLGGKWTTYRRMGYDALKEIENKKLVKKPTGKFSGNQNFLNSEKLSGAVHSENINNQIFSYAEEKKFFSRLESYLMTKYGFENNSLNIATIKDLVFRYGLNATKVLDIDRERKFSEKDRFLTQGDNPILTAELIYSLKYEMAVKPNDFLCRRTGLAFVDSSIAEGLIDKVSEVMGRELKWNNDKVKNIKSEAKINMKYLN